MTSPPSADSSSRPGPPIIKALVAQALAALVVFGGGRMFASAIGINAPMAGLLAAQGMMAAIFGFLFRLPLWWLPIHLLLPPAVAVTLAWKLPAWVFPAAFVALLGVFWNSMRGGVPLYLSNLSTKTALARLLPEKGGFRFADLGCGLGGPVLTLSRVRPEGRFTGFETAPLLFAIAWLRQRFRGQGNGEIRRTDFWSVDLSDFDFVYCFLSPVPMPALYEKARREMRPGSLLISNSFEVPGHPADEIVSVEDRRQTKLHLWKMGEKEKGGEAD
ncbi:MAG: class I SAM-dependent methyltransferase [Proteobacteria bacterium]|nr:class I SAM-dependent methyltransferase [Pseudomonadota bacterium]